uniref:Uncharacterized protein n=1 Tax=Anguilla anguilla TaxID=7936 RepID=A0A0E9TN32_ANGAN
MDNTCNYFDCHMIIGAKCSGSTILETAPLGFSRITVSVVYCVFVHVRPIAF